MKPSHDWCHLSPVSFAHSPPTHSQASGAIFNLDHLRPSSSTENCCFCSIWRSFDYNHGPSARLTSSLIPPSLLNRNYCYPAHSISHSTATDHLFKPQHHQADYLQQQNQEQLQRNPFQPGRSNSPRFINLHSPPPTMSINHPVFVSSPSPSSPTWLTSSIASTASEVPLGSTSDSFRFPATSQACQTDQPCIRHLPSLPAPLISLASNLHCHSLTSTMNPLHVCSMHGQLVANCCALLATLCPARSSEPSELRVRYEFLYIYLSQPRRLTGSFYFISIYIYRYTH
ncbi:unnamed protein product [Protopolystoma xenopodis]|uniref:Uncharacterized protein n=1 Tax=Protopolystoma xenopodis TaxID=117903 RepID=A0A448WVZ5_9PLAT|nr:unnamed protein product [Protopolystoma xenopodis]